MLVVFYFNSIKVRLRHRSSLFATANPPSFQFHKGSIKTNEQIKGLPPPPIFQFHKGSIKTSDTFYVPQQRYNFNSIKVRLRRARLTPDTMRPTQFQFHKGSIKTLISNLFKVNKKIFQFHKGSIKTFYRWFFLVDTRISIP